jgi:hypothetical protein
MNEKNPDFPLHRLNTPKTKLWLISEVWRRNMARTLNRMYRGGVGVCAATGRLFAYVRPDGNIHELKRPFKKYEMWQMANQPSISDCPCMDFFDPEVQGPYRERGERNHHPMCQFERTAGAVFKEAQGKAANRMGLVFEQGMPMVDVMPEAKNSNAASGGRGIVKELTPQARPDEWEQIRRNYQGK